MAASNKSANNPNRPANNAFQNSKSMPRNKLNEQQKRNMLREKLRLKQATNSNPKTICLTMIVKNESRNMVRLLDSLKSIIDMASIVDTGSTDDTEQVIMKWSNENNIQIKVHHQEFVNFSYNRTHSAKMAKKTYPNADFLLFSDADFVWEIGKNGKFDKRLLVDHKYLVEQYNASLSYWNIRMVSNKVDWICKGVTHEYWMEEKKQSLYHGEIRQHCLKTLAIDDREDGGCKQDKFERDERLLKAGLLDPNEEEDLKTRYKFYLGQTLGDMGKYEESIEWYKKRIADKGWYEEVYYSKFKLGKNYEALGWERKDALKYMGKEEKKDFEIALIEKVNPNMKYTPSELLEQSTAYFTDAAVHYMAAYNFCKTRAESLYYLTRMYRALGLNEQAYELAIKGKNIAYPVNERLFIERACYDYNWDFEISIAADYIPGKKDEARDATIRLLQRTDLPEWMVNDVQNNSRLLV